MDPIFAIDLPKISIAAEELFRIGPLSVTNSLLMMFIVMAALVIFFALACRNLQEIPGRRQAAVEFTIESLLNFAAATSGNRPLARRVFPLLATLFLYIIIGNYSGLLPGIGSITVTKDVVVPATEIASMNAEQQSHLTKNADGTFSQLEKVPIFRSPNADLNMTLSMALIVVVLVQVLGVQANGFGYFKEFLNPIHTIGEFSRILSLSLRLFGNIFGGEVLVTVMYALTYVVVPTLFLGLELFFGFIQALIFTVLTVIFISLAVTGHGDHADGNHATESKDGHANELADSFSPGD